MAFNRNHSQNGGVLITNGESVLRECKNVELSFSDVTCKTDLLRGTKKGSVYLTAYRMVFVSGNTKDCLGSAMFPYYLMKDCSIEQPVFAANYIKGTVSAEPNGGWEGQAHFKMSFPSGGAIDVGQHLFKLATNASRGTPAHNGAPSHHGYPSPGMTNGYAPPPPAPPGYPYAPPPQQNGYYPAPPAPPAAGNMGYAYPTAATGMYAPGYDYMAPPPPYPGPPQNWAPPPQNWTAPAPPGPGNAKAAEAASSAYYNPSNPHNVYMPTERPPAYAPYPNTPDKKNN
ncbi:postacrosomal sheath WW domain-binding protein [Nerophis lumbriciformis]|uniref:postacrosomal sheath WW domain-binding protein n=1 Tax=Nerophis lumbriciformis TaxID=546530 RepID=UPI002ADF1AFB|nr:WW domain-binding protein 2-like [Nerophis lumbriciformis]